MSDIGQILGLGRSPGLDTVARLFGLAPNPDNPATRCVDVAKVSDYEIMGMDAPAGVATLLWAFSGPVERRGLWLAAQVASGDVLPPPGTARGEIGALSASYESGTRGPATVSTGKGDNGGVSYGSYQLASKMGQPEAFLASEGKQWQAEFAGLKSGTPTFSKVWRELATREPDALRTAEHAYIQRTHYQVTVDNVVARSGYDVSAHSATLRDVIWSTSVQHGPENRIIDRAIANVDKIMKRDDPRFERALIEAVYAERGRRDAKGGLVYFSRSQGNWPGLEARFKAEGADAVKRYDAEVQSH